MTLPGLHFLRTTIFVGFIAVTSIVPACGYAIGRGTERWHEFGWRAYLTHMNTPRQDSSPSAPGAPLVTFSKACEPPAAAVVGCETLRASRLLARVSLFSVGILALGLLAIGLAGRLCQASEGLLHRAFPPAVRLTLLFCALVITLHVAVLLGSLSIPAAAFGRDSPVPFYVTLAVLMPALLMWLSRHYLVDVAPPAQMVVALEAHPVAFASDGTSEASEKRANRLPARFLVNLDPSVRTFEGRVEDHEGREYETPLCLGLPWLRIATSDELEASLALTSHGRSGAPHQAEDRFWDHYGRVRRWLERASHPSGDENLPQFVVFPAVILLQFLTWSFGLAALHAGEHRYLQRIRSAAAQYEASVVASVLFKEWIVAQCFENVVLDRVAGLNDSTNFSQACAAKAAWIDGTREVETAREHAQPGFMMLDLRLQVLGTSPEAEAVSLLVPPLSGSAIQLVAGFEALEERLTTALVLEPPLPCPPPQTEYV